MMYQCTVYGRDTNRRIVELDDGPEQAARFAAISAVRAGVVAPGVVTVDVGEGNKARQYRVRVEITHSAKARELLESGL